jgi:ATP synthase I chain
MTKTTTTERDAGFNRALVAVVLVGTLSTIVALIFGGVRTGASVGLGAAVGALNLLAIWFVVRGLLARKRSSVPWGLVAVLKFGLLVAVLYFLLKSHAVELLPLLIGYGALPLGITAGQLGAPRALSEEG